MQGVLEEAFCFCFNFLRENGKILQNFLQNFALILGTCHKNDFCPPLMCALGASDSGSA